jgi:hypothetical protein
LLACACSKTDVIVAAPDAGVDSGLSGVFTFVDASPSETAPDASQPFTEVDTKPYLTASPVSGKAIGHTSVVFKLEMSGGLTAAYKPESKRGHSRYRGEIAAYRLAKALGLSNVPPAIPRTFPGASLRAAITSNAKALSLYDSEVVARAGTVKGALMPWIASLEFLPIETDPWRAKWTKWLAKDGEVPVDQASLASQISTLVVFDTVTGNWDRWSGANVGIDKASGTLLYVDNDGAFFEPAPAAPLASQLALLQKIDRYSRRFVAALRALTPIALADAIGDETPGQPLLEPKTLSSVDGRRRNVLVIIDAKIKDQGESKVLPVDW